jgi:hypothetical protein
MVEYILLVGISVILILGVVYQFNDSFRRFSNLLFVGEDSYLACLVKAGVIPWDSSGVCDPPKFNLKAGKNLADKMDSSGAGHTDSGASKNSGSNGKSAAGGSASSGGSGRSSKVREGSGGATIPLNGGDGIGFKVASGKGAQGAGGSKGAGPEAYTGSSGVSSGSITGDGTAAGAQRSGLRPGYVPMEGQVIGGDRRGDRTIPTNERDRKSAQMIAAEKARKQASATQDEEKFSFSWIFKFVLIFALLFAIIFFVGSQIVAVVRGGQRQ